MHSNGANGRGPAVIEASGLSKDFNSDAAVSDVSFQVPQGVLFGFVGPSGAGKTTVMRLLTGTYLPTAGKVAVLGREPRRFTAAMRSRLGYMPQHFVLYPNLSVWENMNFAASLYGMGLNRGSRLHEVLQFVELDEHRHKLARHISGGMQRRLALAATLAHSPDVMFLDEPTAGIDPILRRKFWDYFERLRDAGRTLFITTQYVAEAAYCDLIGVMSGGRLLTVDTPDGLRHRAYGGEMVDLRIERALEPADVAALRTVPAVRSHVLALDDSRVRLLVDEASTAMPLLMELCQGRNIPIVSIEEYVPSFDDVFVELFKQDYAND